MVRPAELNLPQSGKHDYHFRVQSDVVPDSTIVVMLSREPSGWNARALSWNELRTWMQFPAEEFLEWRLYILRAAHWPGSPSEDS